MSNGLTQLWWVRDYHTFYYIKYGFQNYIIRYDIDCRKKKDRIFTILDNCGWEN